MSVHSGITRWPLILVGAGLASAVIAARLSQRNAATPILMLESSAVPFGEHTWSFHVTDLPRADVDNLSPMIAHRWPRQVVKFNDYERTLSSGYASLTSSSVAQAMSLLSNLTLKTGATVAEVGPSRVKLLDGTVFEADCVIDARGFQPHAALVLGYQKFFGLEVETVRPHGLSNPIIMDASVDQKDGYRFIYVLPFSPTRLLIEDTRYSDSGGLNTQSLASDIDAYAAERGWPIARVVRSEHGVLPILLAHDAEAFWREKPADVPQAGMRAALFHPTTGYSLPEAVRLANLVVDTWPIGSAELASRIEAHALDRWRKHSFSRLLNRMLFRAALPHRRHLVLQRFYTLRQPLIERFYAGDSTLVDKARILTGKPPVPFFRALGCVDEEKLLTAPIA